MRNVILLMLLCLLLSGCSTENNSPDNTLPTTAAPIQLGNPWKSYTSIEEAEAACGLTFPLTDLVAGSYAAESWRVMNGQLLEVVYRDQSFEVTVRMQAGEDQDLSGVYEEFEKISTIETDTYTITNKKIKDGGMVQLISKNGYSYSFYAPNHYWGDSNADFLAFLTQ